MSTVNCTVVRGHTPTLDENGEYQPTPTRLKLIATPGVTITLTDEIQAEDIKLTAVTKAELNADVVDGSTLAGGAGTALSAKDKGITIAKLADAVQDLIATIALTGTDDKDNTGTMSIQVRDAAGNNLAQRSRVRTWISTSDYGAPVARTDFSVTTGTELQEVEANADYEVITDATGKVVMNIDEGGAGTVYVMAEVNGRIYSAQLDITAP